MLRLSCAVYPGNWPEKMEFKTVPNPVTDCDPAPRTGIPTNVPVGVPAALTIGVVLAINAPVGVPLELLVPARPAPLYCALAVSEGRSKFFVPLMVSSSLFRPIGDSL